MDGKSQFSSRPMAPLGEEPILGPARPNSGAQAEQQMPLDQPPPRPTSRVAH